jgi:hypothetical protein
MANYKAAEQLMQHYNNTRGLGVCYNNQANILREQDRLEEAKVLYDKAVALAQARHDAAQLTAEKMAEKVTWANRLMNLGVLRRQMYLASNKQSAGRSSHVVGGNVIDPDVALIQSCFERAMALFRAADDALGVAKVSGNLSLVSFFFRLISVGVPASGCLVCGYCSYISIPVT